jgi:hypothetical protein
MTRRPLILVGVLAAIVGLAFLVARPSKEPPAATPYVGDRGASRAKASGLGLALVRGGEITPLAPGTPVAAGDVLRFTVRAEHARHLLVLLRDGDAAATVVFPVGGGRAASSVQPGEILPTAPPLSPARGKVVVTAVFADHPFSLDDLGGDGTHGDLEEIDVVMEKS